MLARLLDPEGKRVVLLCGPHWSTRCGAAGERASTTACAGRTMLVDRKAADGLHLVRMEIPPDQRTCPFGPAEAGPAL